MATIQGVYVALFGRPADPAGLAFFSAATGNGANLAAIGDLAATREYADRFSGLSNDAIVNAIYRSLFNRDAEAGGRAFFVDALNRGSITINNVAIAILDGARGDDKLVVDAKIASADVFTAAIDTTLEFGGYAGNAAAARGRTFLADVTTSAKTSAQADAALAAIVAGGVINTTISLTPGADALRIVAMGSDPKPFTITLGGGPDSVTVDSNVGNVAAADTTANLLATLITITDFTRTEDTLRFDVVNPATDRKLLQLAEAARIEGSADMLAATASAAALTGVGKVVAFGYRGDTYLYQNNGTPALEGGDTLIRLAGVSASDLTASNFELI
jgi:hypothetical protein